uniref:Uncharacterized protein n=1 Tax=Arundo donax TaxID=35708 RepID=A0A0A9CWR6_ARUDO
MLLYSWVDRFVLVGAQMAYLFIRVVWSIVLALVYLLLFT